MTVRQQAVQQQRFLLDLYIGKVQYSYGSQNVISSCCAKYERYLRWLRLITECISIGDLWTELPIYDDCICKLSAYPSVICELSDHESWIFCSIAWGALLWVNWLPYTQGGCTSNKASVSFPILLVTPRVHHVQIKYSPRLPLNSFSSFWNMGTGKAEPCAVLLFISRQALWYSRSIRRVDIHILQYSVYWTYTCLTAKPVNAAVRGLQLRYPPWRCIPDKDNSFYL